MAREVVGFEELDTLQRRAVEAPAGPVLTLGGPGSGTSTVLTGRAVSMARGGSDRGRMIVVTLDPLGPEKFLKACSLMTGSTEPVIPFCFTPCTLANFILRNGGALVLGIPEAYSLWDRRQARRMFAQAANPVRRSRRLSDDAISQMYRWYRGTLTQLAQDVPDEVDGASCEQVSSDYCRLMERSRCLDEDQAVVLATAALLRSQELREYWDFGRDGHVFVDDIHAATPAQYLLVALLGGPGASISATGDPHLPGRRLLERFREDHPDVEVHRLNRAYLHTEPLTSLWAGFGGCDPRRDSSLTRVEAHRGDGDAPVVAELGMDIPAIAGFIQQQGEHLVAQGLDYGDIACDCDEASLAESLMRELEQRGIPCAMAGDQDGRSGGVTRALGLMAWVINPVDPASFARAAFAGDAGEDDLAVSQVVREIFDAVHSSGAEPSQASMDMSRNFAPDDPVHQGLVRVVAARNAMEGLLRDFMLDFPDIVEGALRICGVDTANPDPEIRLLMEASRIGEGGGQGDMEENLVRFLDRIHPERSLATAGRQDGMVITAGIDGTGRYRKAVFVIRLGTPGGEAHDDPAVYRAVTSATDHLFFVCGSSQVADDVRKLLSRSRRRQPVEPPARPPELEEVPGVLSEEERPRPPAVTGGGEPGNPVTPGQAAKRPSVAFNPYEWPELSSDRPESWGQPPPDPPAQPVPSGRTARHRGSASGEILGPDRGDAGGRAAGNRQPRGPNGDQVGPIIVTLILLLGAVAVALLALVGFGILKIDVDVEWHGFTARPGHAAEEEWGRFGWHRPAGEHLVGPERRDARSAGGFRARSRLRLRRRPCRTVRPEAQPWLPSRSRYGMSRLPWPVNLAMPTPETP